jgi:hypothetical protein
MSETNKDIAVAFYKKAPDGIRPRPLASLPVYVARLRSTPVVMTDLRASSRGSSVLPAKRLKALRPFAAIGCGGWGR